MIEYDGILYISTFRIFIPIGALYLSKDDDGMSYVISDELRETLLVIIGLLQKNATKRYWKNSDKYSDELRLENGNTIPLPFLSEIQNDLQNAEKVIQTNEYDTKAEELILIAKEMGLL